MPIIGRVRYIDVASNNLASLPGREGGGLINPLKPGNEAKKKIQKEHCKHLGSDPQIANLLIIAITYGRYTSTVVTNS